MLACSGNNSNETPITPEEESLWQGIKANASVNIALSSEYQNAQALPISTLGWEDGLNVSEDGLYLYATYIPADFLSFVLKGDTVDQLQVYDRGPHYDMDLVQNLVGASYPWYHSDIIFSSRASLNDSFSPWSTSNMKRSVYSEGGVSTSFSTDKQSIDFLAFTSNDVLDTQNNIKLLSNVSVNPSGNGSLITTIDPAACGGSSLNSINTNCIEDNPHIQRLTANRLLLFFDSEDRTNGLGSHDIYYSISDDNASTWSTPLPVTSINTSNKEHQPHLHFDGSDWWLYFSAYHSDNKLAIFRSKQGIVDDWDSWQNAELVISAGNTEGIGEPTLSENGDLYFVAILKNDAQDSYDKYDADPWMAKHK